MRFLARLLGKKEDRLEKSGPPQIQPRPARIPWGLLIGGPDDLCIVIGRLDQPIVAAAIVMNLDFFEPDGTIAPVRLTVTYADGGTGIVALADIVPDALSEIIVAPSILVCVVDGNRIDTMLPAAIFMANQKVLTSDQRYGRDAAVYAATVTKILHPGTAALPWRALVRLEKEGSLVAPEAEIGLYPPPPLEIGMTTAVIGTLEPPHRPGENPQLGSDTVQNPLARLAAFADPFQIEVAVGTTSSTEIEGVNSRINAVVSTIASLAAQIYGYVPGTLHPYLRPLGTAIDPVIASAKSRFSTTLEELDAIDWNDPDGFGYEPGIAPGVASTPTLLRSWGILDIPELEESIIFDRVSSQAPVSAELVMHDHPLEVDGSQASPFSLKLAYADGTVRSVILAETDDETYDRIRMRCASRILELDGEAVALNYPIARQIEAAPQA